MQLSRREHRSTVHTAAMKNLVELMTIVVKFSQENAF